ncbi:hypothetical protein NQ318_019011 [Aromia moschata]|uniref:Uncharacterized protein n=1 Tax=Aromia moschata TaxID=1265417 RepID=A0AAV8XK13_9CUCU|nr:hypothetical protein NQ318_019011 [Aromia moschata]
MVPKLLTPDQEESRMNICADILNNIETDPSFVEAVKGKAAGVLNQLTEKRTSSTAFNNGKVVWSDVEIAKRSTLKPKKLLL